MDCRNRPFYQAAISKFESQRDEAIATLDLYFTNAVGIGEHSNLLDEIEKWTATLAEAEERIESLKKHFGGRSETVKV